MRRLVPLVLVALCAGCAHHEVAYHEPVVLGERIFIVRAGEYVVVPEPKPPAKTWYLVDDMGLSLWLGIPYSHIPDGQTAYDQAMEELDEDEKFQEELEDGVQRRMR